MFSPKERAWLRKNSVYAYWSRQTVSGITLSTLVTAIQAIDTTDPNNLVLLKYLYTLLDAAQRRSTGENVEGMLLKNDEVLAAIVEAGGDPVTTHYPLKTVKSAVLISGGAGAFTAATLLAAVTGKRILIEEISINCTTQTAAAGVRVIFKDGASGTAILECSVGQHQCVAVMRPLVAGTSATLLEWVGTAQTFPAMADNDIVNVNLKYREI